ncbi:hypothetical protein AUP68_14111 [Ilyonectria robusta]
MVQFPAGDGSWYILRCDKHDINFKNHPIKGAAKHLGGKQHGRMSRKPSVAIKHLGVKVLNCNKILAEKNNVAALEALQKEHKHPTADMVDNEPKGDLIPTSVYKAPARKTQESQGRAGKALPTDGSSQQVTDVEVITEPIPGEFYLAYRKGSTDRCPVLLLPLGHLDNVGVPDAVEILGLIDSVPACYVYNQSANDLVWQEGYEDGGPLVAKRQFPVMYLDGSEFPNRGLVGWVGAEDLRPFDVQGSDSSLVRQCNSVRDFLRKRAETTSEDTATDFNILLEGVSSSENFNTPPKTFADRLMSGCTEQLSRQIPSSSSALAYSSHNPSSKETEAPTWPLRIPIPVDEKNPISQDVNETKQDAGLGLRRSSNHQPEAWNDVISISSSSTRELIDVISINSSSTEELVDVEDHHSHGNNFRIPAPNPNTSPEVTRPFTSSAEQFSSINQLQNTKSVALRESALVTLNPQAATPQNMPPAIGGQFGMLLPSPIPPINPMNSPVREQVMQTSTFHWPPSITQPQDASYPMLCEEHFTYTSNSESAPCQLPPILPRLRAQECGLVGPGPITASSTLWARQIDNRLPSIGDYLKQTLPPAMPPRPSPRKASLAVNSPAWEHVPPRGFHMLSFRAAELGVPNIEAQTTTPQTSQASFRAIEPRFGVEPYVVPEQLRGGNASYFLNAYAIINAPESDSPIVRGRGHHGRVVREGYGPYPVSIALELLDECAIINAPEPDRLIFGG